MFNKLTLTFLIIFSFLITTIYPSKKEKTNLFDYCFSLEKLLVRNSVEKSQNVSKNVKNLAKDISSLGINNTKGALANKVIDQYKNSKKSYIINFVPNQFYCLAGYFIEKVNPGIFQSIFYKESKKRINEYINLKKETDEFIKDINSEYKSLKKEANEFIQDINSEYESIKKEIYDFF